MAAKKDITTTPTTTTTLRTTTTTTTQSTEILKRPISTNLAGVIFDTCATTSIPKANRLTWTCSTTPEQNSFKAGTTCQASCGPEFTYVCSGEAWSDKITCLSANNWSVGRNCRCVSTVCPAPRMFTKKSLRLGATYVSGLVQKNVFKIGETVRPRCPEDTRLDCKGVSGEAVCKWNGAKVSWSSRPKCSCISTCPDPKAVLSFQKDVTLQNDCSAHTNKQKCAVQCPR